MSENIRKSEQIQTIRVTGRSNLQKLCKQKKKLRVRYQGGICIGVTRKEERPPQKKTELTEKRTEKEEKRS